MDDRMTQEWSHIGYFDSSGKNNDELNELKMIRKWNGSGQMSINISSGNHFQFILISTNVEIIG